MAEAPRSALLAESGREPAPTPENILAASAALSGIANITPVFTSRTLDALVGANVYLKAESLQRSGSFKFRGAFTKIHSLDADARRRGVVTASSGNHGQAVALAARELGAPALVFVPTDASRVKQEAIRAYGADVVHYERETDDREALVDAIVNSRGLTYVAAYDDPVVISGQGTVAVELVDQIPRQPDMLIVPVGGGSLISGTGTYLDHVSPRTQIVGVEPAAGNDAHLSLRAGKRVTIPIPTTVADGLRLPTPGRLTFSIMSRLVDDIVLVSETQIARAVRFALLRLKLLVEPSGAVALAALLSGRVDVRGLCVAAVVTGGNVDPQVLSQLVARSEASAPDTDLTQERKG